MGFTSADINRIWRDREEPQEAAEFPAGTRVNFRIPGLPRHPGWDGTVLDEESDEDGCILIELDVENPQGRNLIKAHPDCLTRRGHEEPEAAECPCRYAPGAHCDEHDGDNPVCNCRRAPARWCKRCEDCALCANCAHGA